jgi:hypothetical protein
LANWYIQYSTVGKGATIIDLKNILKNKFSFRI